LISLAFQRSLRPARQAPRNDSLAEQIFNSRFKSFQSFLILSGTSQVLEVKIAISGKICLKKSALKRLKSEIKSAAPFFSKGSNFYYSI
jgi:hypothetical protein